MAPGAAGTRRPRASAGTDLPGGPDPSRAMMAGGRRDRGLQGLLAGGHRPGWFGAGLATVLLLAVSAGVWARRPEPCAPTKEGRRGCLEGAIFLRVPVPKRGGLAWVALRYTGDKSNLKALEAANPLARRRRLLEARIPLDLLLPRYRDEALGALFPKDHRTAKGWEHAWAGGPTGTKENWGDLARWFTGNAGRAKALERANRKAGRKPKPGTRVLVPEDLLLAAIQDIQASPPEGTGPPQAAAAHGERAGARPPAKAAESAAPSPGPPVQGPPSPFVGPPAPPAGAVATAGVPPAASPSATTAPAGTGPSQPAPQAEPGATAGSQESVPLTYGRDARGPYAIYRLQAGEALYSAVVVRFTGTVSAEDVNALARDIAKRSDIRDVTGIPVGYPVKIPLEDLLPQYLPHDDPQYMAWAENQAEMGTITNTYKNAVLDGVVVVLDAGHGGLDRGAMAHGVWEDSYVYDIVCRIRDGLERRTKARVLMTLLDPHLGYRPQDKTELAPNTDAVILTHPWFRQTSRSETHVEVNLRWHLANQYYQRLQKEGVDPQRVVFTSVHADSLYPTLRGTMFYIPGSAYRSNRWCSSGPLYDKYAEFKASPCYQETDRQLKRSEGLSYQLARQLEKAFTAAKLTLHPYNPTRDHVVRGRRSWVPAVLRDSIIPCAVLVEVCNLNNAQDAKLIADPCFRQAVADAYIEGLIKYYS